MAGSRESKINTHRSLNRRIIWRATYVGQICSLFDGGAFMGKSKLGF